MKAPAYLFTVDLNIGDIVLEHGWHVNFRKLIFAKHNQQAGFTTGTVADDDQFLSYRGHFDDLHGTDFGRLLPFTSVCWIVLAFHTRAKRLDDDGFRAKFRFENG